MRFDRGATRIALLAGAAVGVVLMAVLAVRQGRAALDFARGTAGPALAAAAAFQVIPLALYTASWRVLLPPGLRPGGAVMFRFRWIGASLNALLPAAQVGGDLARAHLLVARGVPGPTTAATTIGDFTAGAATQVVFTVAGLAALLLVGHGSGIAAAAAMGALLLGGASAFLLLVMRRGLGRIAAAFPRMARALSTRAADVDGALAELFRRRGDVGSALALHLAGWFSQAGETWLILALLGAPVGIAQALAIESLAWSARGLAFFVPAGLGVQEGAIFAVAVNIGVPAPAALALALVKRARELVVSLPAVVTWLVALGKRRRSPERWAP
jgi:putative membrane protein